MLIVINIRKIMKNNYFIEFLSNKLLLLKGISFIIFDKSNNFFFF